ncbi:BadF/BadG/BcrA/BcrD ATPase family protein [Hamadaea tsunoensis]|uniref:BadF/BadG/BcrA/BcrD ATPase family protein n=1 Tax=Hamadaea tsunoensis TaxID=53368 RepID=UPI0003F6A0DD|nr:BadF/BadG/BcrA/BcrD ATPase family protein [Hamadaea tsunoensis]
MIAGVDIGGTKTHVRVAAPPDLVVADRVFPSEGWSLAAGGSWIVERLAGTVSEDLTALVVGAQGAEEPAHCAALRAELSARLGIPVLVVNDAQLLLPAAGLRSGIAVVVGTGSIAFHDDGSGGITRAGGWGWILGDDGSASALVREAARSVLAAADRGRPPTALARRLLAAVGVDTPGDLALALSWGSAPERWGDLAPVVTAAAAEGSPDAAAILAAGADAIVDLVRTLAGRGLPVEDVVFAGGLVTKVASYWAAIRDRLLAEYPDARPRLLTEPPVTGAIRLAATL